MSEKLGPLPAPEFSALADGQNGIPQITTGYTADQMHTYAAQEVAKERERCAKLCEDSDTFDANDPGGFFASLIRGA